MCHSEPPTVAQHPTPAKPLPIYLLDAFRCSAHLFLTQQEAPGPHPGCRREKSTVTHGADV
ncbi:hypothetical protein QC761_0036560 [Podospora bellae-mahoneyi]|uniref:Uncharacterized protein n=1 Tax=Podospora bellae-mahoneyi TaxID=2093777 RepID=A0ABR0FS78_9PEZI|nr:hypothetical protein QC761_0036560 [Podospora bellae-mahoneyi]